MLIKILTLMSSIVIHLIIYAQALRGDNQFMGPFIVGFGRVLWSWAISWLIIVSSTGHLKIIERISNKKITVVLSRLTYSVYLVNPICILCISMLMEKPIHLSGSSVSYKNYLKNISNII